MSKPRLLWLTDRGEWHRQRALRYAPPELDVLIVRRPAPEELRYALPGVDYLISERSEAVDGWMIAAAPKLKLIVRLGSLLHDIDIQAARAANVRISMQPVLGSVYCAEHALMMILAVIKKLRRSLHAANAANHGIAARRTDEDTFAFNWLGFSDIGGLIGQRVAILGMGEIGVELARRLKGFAVRDMLYHKRSPYSQSIERDLGVQYATLERCAAEADVLVSLLPYSAQTDHLLNAAFFARMRPSAVMVHLGSGSVIDELALVEALKAGRLAGAALDTFEYEPLQPDHPLVALARDPASTLLLTPHTAAASLPPDRSADYGEVLRLMRGEVLLYEQK